MTVIMVIMVVTVLSAIYALIKAVLSKNPLYFVILTLSLLVFSLCLENINLTQALADKEVIRYDFWVQ